jgi:hypothetical protein
MATITIDASGQGFNIDCVVPSVFRYTTDPKKYFHLPNVRARNIGAREGLNPGTAEFEYVFDDDADARFPNSIEDVIQATSASRYVVRPDDRIVVGYFDGNGTFQIMFDGFAQIPEVMLGSGEHASFQCIGTPVRLWDTPIRKSTYRDGSKATDPTAYHSVDLRVHFNPDGKRNCSPAAHQSTITYSSGPNAKVDNFLDPGSASVEAWTIGRSVVYLLVWHNDETYVQNPDLVITQILLDAWEPTNGNAIIDPADASTYKKVAITTPDYDASYKPLAEAIFDLISPHGYTIIWRLEADDESFPTWILDIVRTNESTSTDEKSIALPKRGEKSLDLSTAATSDLKIAFDASMIVNAYTSLPALTQYEATFILAPLFRIAAGDVDDLTIYKTSAPGFDAVRKMYRWFGLDELGEGHWNLSTAEWETTPPALKDLLGGKDGKGQFVQRYRTGKRKVRSLDSTREKNDARLSWIRKTDYSGTVPGVWDGSTDLSLFHAIKGDWRIDDDRLAVLLDCDDPSAFSFGDHKDLDRSGVMSIVEWLNDPAKAFYFALTTIIEGDDIREQVADRRPSSPSNFVISRVLDSKHRYKPIIVSKRGEYNVAAADALGVAAADVNADDYEADSLADASTHRFATETPPYSGPISFPYISQAYKLGDRIKSIEGRALSFAPSIGNEVPSYPRVVGIEWDFQTPKTTIHLSDRRVGKEGSHGR